MKSNGKKNFPFCLGPPLCGYTKTKKNFHANKFSSTQKILYFHLFEFDMALSKEQIRLLLHFQWMQEIPANKAAETIRDVYGQRTVSQATAYNWYRTFHEEGMRLTDNSRSGRPREIDREAVINAVEENPTLTTRMIGDDFEYSHTEIEKILHEAGKFS
jgi:hypothetical protein